MCQTSETNWPVFALYRHWERYLQELVSPVTNGDAAAINQVTAPVRKLIVF
ncbi:hypothetical protein [Lactiplantibacillus pentosus]|jgi:hypothetical protein|uniref:hypothetical protein n=1 Tax=Lactiplantibacillus pentosus TaxID=1589 RepID=UPI0014031FD7|nr:hypothetical protein [Lactiplantibacillus pentosus]USJ85410.1 hypothetical protein KSF55_11705 [Lactiplantibacillus pentosus]